VLLWRGVFSASLLPADMLMAFPPWKTAGLPAPAQWNALLWDSLGQYFPWRAFAGQALRSGHIPLWNPYQFCGTPFLAMGWTGIFYPPRLVNLVLEVPIALEALFLFHMFLGALGLWWLARRLGISVVGGLCAALTFVWSGWLTHHVNAPAILESMTWMPLIILLLDGVALGRRFAWLGLIGALTCAPGPRRCADRLAGSRFRSAS
jgi:hypothetical protein